MDLFDFNNNEEKAKPLAERMRANSLDEFIGQKHIVAEGSLLRRAIATDRLGSCIFWGPPGCGKTTLANVIALRTNGEFIKLNAVNSGVADVKKAVDEARDNLKMYGKRTYLMLDECHRFSKTQSDSLLPAIEQGTIIFIGSTTENREWETPAKSFASKYRSNTKPIKQPRDPRRKRSRYDIISYRRSRHSHFHNCPRVRFEQV